MPLILDSYRLENDLLKRRGDKRKLIPCQRERAKQLWHDGYSYARLGRMFGVHRETIRLMIHGYPKPKKKRKKSNVAAVQKHRRYKKWLQGKGELPPKIQGTEG